MSLPTITSRDDWAAARRELLTREKEYTRALDALNADRRRLPMVRVDQEYPFDGPAVPGPGATVGLADLFEGRRQLIVQHFMFDPSWDAGCSSCTAAADEVSPGLLDHLHARETTFAVVSRAPLAKIAAYQRSRGWTFPWYSAEGSDFNYDYHATIDESVAPMEINYRNKDELLASPTFAWVADSEQPFELPGYSCFLRDGDDIFHTYSVYARGTESLGGAYAFLDLTALGRQEQWEEPKGRAVDPHAAQPDFS